MESCKGEKIPSALRKCSLIAALSSYVFKLSIPFPAKSHKRFTVVVRMTEAGRQYILLITNPSRRIPFPCR